MTKTQRTRLLKWCWQWSRVCNTQPEVSNNYDKELIFYANSGAHSWHTNRYFSWKILIAGLFLVNLTVTTAPRQKTWLIRPFLCNSLHFPHKNQ